MKIGISAFGCNHGRSGIGAYIYSLIHNLPEMEHQIQVFGPQFDKYIYTTDLNPSFYEGVALENDAFAEKFFLKTGLEQFSDKMQYDAVLFPTGMQNLPLTFSKPAFLVIQEIIRTNKRFSIFGSINRMTQKNILEKASGIISTSRYVKDSLVEFGISEKKIKVIYNGIDTAIFHPKTDEKDLSSLKVPFVIKKPYIIYASTISEPEKRHLELIKAFEIFKQRTDAAHRLVIAGQEGRIAPAVHQAVLSSSAVSDIILAGYIEQRQLANFYQESDLCVFPSEMEGSGLPVIEAVACGIPTACANASALPEVAGESTYYFDASNPHDIADAIESLVSDGTAKRENLRQEIIQNGLNWVKRYDWKKTASKTVEYILKQLKN